MLHVRQFLRLFMYFLWRFRSILIVIYVGFMGTWRWSWRSRFSPLCIRSCILVSIDGSGCRLTWSRWWGRWWEGGFGDSTCLCGWLLYQDIIYRFSCNIIIECTHGMKILCYYKINFLTQDWTIISIEKHSYRMTNEQNILNYSLHSVWSIINKRITKHDEAITPAANVLVWGKILV